MVRKEKDVFAKVHINLNKYEGYKNYCTIVDGHNKFYGFYSGDPNLAVLPKGCRFLTKKEVEVKRSYPCPKCGKEILGFPCEYCGCHNFNRRITENYARYGW